MSRPTPRRPGATSRRRGGTPLAVALLLALGAAFWVVHAIASDARAEGVTELDPRRVALAAPPWAPTAWREWIAARIAEAGPVSTLDRAALDALVAEIAAMPQVAAVHDARVVWPDGLQLELDLRRPVACLRTGGEFLSVAADGVVLPGYTPAPPDAGAGPLPVIGPNDLSFEGTLPGDVLTEEHHLDALSVALSLERHLDVGRRRRLGPVLIDASAAARASVSEPGVRLYLEARRLALFGRAPRAGAPGELPETTKWRHLALALDRLEDPAGGDWDLIDLRWDRAPIRPRTRE